MKFDLYKDELIHRWVRSYYTIEAESEQEALNKILNEECDPDEYDDLVEADYWPSVVENKGFPTIEIFNTDKKIYSNEL